MDEIRLGTIGSGVIVHSILKNVLRVDGIRLTAVYSRSLEIAEAMAQAYGAESVYTDVDAFLKDEKINFVYIATPNILHYEQAKRALLAGKNVILEKPFCTTREHAAELVSIARERGLILVDATTTAFYPNLKILRHILPEIGNIRLVQASYCKYSSRYDNLLHGELPNIFNPAFGGGCLMDLNYYNVYLNVLLFGKPLNVEYFPNMYHGKVDTSGILILKYGEFTSHCTAAKDTWGVNDFQIQGEQGYIRIPEGSNGLKQIDLVTKDSTESWNLHTESDQWYYEVKRLTELVLAGKEDVLDTQLDVMLDVIGVLELARQKTGILFPGD